MKRTVIAFRAQKAGTIQCTRKLGSREVNVEPADAAKHVSQDVLEQADKLLALGVAEEAISILAWMLGPLALILVFFGFSTYRGIQSKIDGFLKQAEKDLDKKITDFESESDKQIKTIKRKGEEAISAISHHREIVIDEMDQAAVRPSTRVVARTRKERPIGAGLSISTLNTTAMTVCCIAVDRKGKEYLLIDNTSIYGEPTGTAIIQPGSFDGGTEQDRVGQIARTVDLDLSGGMNASLGGIVSIDEATESYRDIPELGRISGILPHATVGQVVKKFGRTTGLTVGQILATSAIVRMNLGKGRTAQFSDAYIVKGLQGVVFSRGGDSGAPVLTEKNELCGMVIGGDLEQTIVMPIQRERPIKPPYR